ncbi:MAG: 3-phosphoshikimate 1-carboxyvinyltransferase [Abditibacteriaceae bacterium]
MKLKISPAANIKGTVTVPGDKSISHRAAILGALANGETHITNFLCADDTLCTLDILRQLGVEVLREGTHVAIHNRKGYFETPHEPLYCGNSGTVMRLMAGVLAGQGIDCTLTGDESLSRRPMARIVVPLSMMRARIIGDGETAMPPLRIQGCPIQGMGYPLPIPSAQVKSAILLAGLGAAGQTTVIESVPSRDHTERMLEGFGCKPEIKELSRGRKAITVTGGSKLHGTNVEVPGDISSAAFLFAAAALRPGWQVTVRNVGVNPTRSGVLDVLQEMGAKVLLSNERESGGEQVADVTVTGAPLRGVIIGGALIPRLIDELPVLAALATQADGETVIRDAHELRVKESDRIEIISRELCKMGADIVEREDGMTVRGLVKLKGTEVISPSGDHRIAMTLAVAALVADGDTTIKNPEAIQSSFPNFVELLDSVAERK